MPFCGRCKRPLNDPQSIEAGLGPICRAKIKVQKTQPKLIPLSPAGDIVLERKNGVPCTNVPRTIIRHSPDGFEWGYGGSGPADLALNVLAMFVGIERAQENGLYQKFKWRFIAKMPFEGGVIKHEDILAFLEENGCYKVGEEKSE